MLLSGSSATSPALHIDENFEAVIMYMAKLVVSSVDSIPGTVFMQLFRAIAAFALAFYGADRPHFGRFVSEWPLGFASNYILSIFERFFPQYQVMSLRSAVINQMVAYAVLTVLVFIYFSNDPGANPFLKVIEGLPEEHFATVLGPIQVAIEAPFAAIALYVVMTSREKFKEFCVSCVDVQWILILTRQISKTNPSGAELRLNILLMLSEDSGFLSGLGVHIVSHLFGFLRESLPDESMHQSILTAISVITNIGRKLSGFDAGLGDGLFLLIRWCLKLRESGNRFVEYLRLLTLFAESMAVHRGRPNLGIVYEILRNARVFSKFDGVLDVSEDPVDFRRSLQNVRVMIRTLTESVLVQQPPSAGYEKIMADLRTSLELWSPEELFEIRSFPVFAYLCHDFRQSVTFFRIMILKEIQGLFCGS
jgi:hypothetical protein